MIHAVCRDWNSRPLDHQSPPITTRLLRATSFVDTTRMGVGGLKTGKYLISFGVQSSIIILKLYIKNSN